MTARKTSRFRTLPTPFYFLVYYEEYLNQNCSAAFNIIHHVTIRKRLRVRDQGFSIRSLHMLSHTVS